MYFTDNGANATVKGAELEVEALLTAQLQLTTNAGTLIRPIRRTIQRRTSSRARNCTMCPCGRRMPC